MSEIKSMAVDLDKEKTREMQIDLRKKILHGERWVKKEGKQDLSSFPPFFNRN